MKRPAGIARATAVGVALWTAIASSWAADRADSAPAARTDRPKTCLVLSGGGARGAAHIGVIKILEALRVPIDCITGTSMGALVGAAYASGNPIEQLEQLALGLSTELLFNERLPRQEQSMRRKQDDLSILFGPDLGFRDGSLLLPKGIVSGVQLERIIRHLARVGDVRDFDRLPIPFRAVATDLATGKPVVLASGELANAMRASMSVPGAVAPAEFDGMILVDGGLTNNLPVDVARAMGAEIVIAVNLGTPLLKRDALGSVFGVTAQMMNILTEQNVQASLASLRPTDILIEPELGDFSAADFGSMGTTIPIGEAAARRVTERLQALTATPDRFAAHRARQQAIAAPDARRIDEVRFNGLRAVNPRYAETLIDARAGQTVDTDTLDRDTQRLFGTGDFEHVGYRFLEEHGKRILVVDAVEKSWGPNYLRFGLGLSSDFRGDAYYNLLARYRRTWLNSLGAEWRSEVQIGRTDRLLTELYQPLDDAQSVFVAPYAQIERRSLDLFSGNQRVARFDVRSSLVGVDLGRQLTKFAEARVGLVGGRAKAKLDTGPDTLAPGEVDVTQAAWRAQLAVDQLDSVNFPRAGYGGSLSLLGARRGLGGDRTYNRWETDGVYVRSFGEHTLNLGYKFGRSTGSVAELFQWGGFLQQSGHRTGALLGDSLSFGRIVYYNKLARQTMLEGLYAGMSLEAGKLRNPPLGGHTGLLRSAALFLGVDTPLGPLYVAYGRTHEGLYSYYLFLGRP